MDLEIRPIDAAGWQRFCRTMAVAYGSGDDDGEDADLAPTSSTDAPWPPSTAARSSPPPVRSRWS